MSAHRIFLAMIAMLPPAGAQTVRATEVSQIPIEAHFVQAKQDQAAKPLYWAPFILIGE